MVENNYGLGIDCNQFERIEKDVKDESGDGLMVNGRSEHISKGQSAKECYICNFEKHLKRKKHDDPSSSRNNNSMSVDGGLMFMKAQMYL